MEIQDSDNGLEITGNESLIDSIEIEARIKYLYSLYEKEASSDIDCELEREVEEYKMLEASKEDALCIYSLADWESGIIFVRYTYFKEYIMDRLSDDYNLDDIPNFIRYNINWNDVVESCADEYNTVSIGDINYYTLN